MAVIGIDLGTTNSLVACWRQDGCVMVPNALGEFLTPSVVSVGENGEVLTGKSAKERLVSHPQNTAACFKQFMGTDKTYTLGKYQFRPEELSSFVLRRLKEDAETLLGEPVEEAVISVPAYFNDVQRSATKQAGELAGFRVDRIINEPSAASLAYQKDQENDGVFLVFDFGGGTLDISVVEMFANIVDIIAVSGDNRLGGTDIDQMIRDAFMQENPELDGRLSSEEKASLLKLAEQSKMALTNAPSTMMVYMKNDESYSMALDNKKLGEICAPLLLRMRETLQTALRDSQQSIQSIDDVILVGGSCRMPLVKDYIRYLTGKPPLDKIDPDQTVAYGVGMVSGIKSRADQIRDMVLTDICPFTLGVKANSGDAMGPVFSPIIQRNTTLPTSRRGVYTTAQDRQKEVTVDVYQGESLRLEQNLHLGSLSIQVPPLPKGEVSIVVQFTYDINGILEVDVECEQNQSQKNMLLVSNGRLSPEDLASRRKDLQKFKTSPRTSEENQYLIARGERLYEEHTGIIREQIQIGLTKFAHTLETQGDFARAAKMRAQLSAFFDRIDGYDDGLLDYGEEW